MAICLARSVDASCTSCGSPFEDPVWVAVDLVERPDLRAMLASGAVGTLGCARCGARTPRSEPLLVTRLSSAAPVLLALPYELLGGGNPAASALPLVDEVFRRMGDEAGKVPGPFLMLPFDVLAVAAGRDLAADAGDIDAARAAVGGEGDPTAMNYALFLQDVRDSTPARRLEVATHRLGAVTSAEELEQLAGEFPELVSRAARDEVEAWSARAVDDEERHVARARLRMLELAARGDYAAAWGGYQQAVDDWIARYVAPRVERLEREIEECEEAGDLNAALAAGEELLRAARGHQELEAEASSRVAAVLLAVPGPGRADRIERVIGLLTRTAGFFDRRADANDKLRHAKVLSNLGYAFSVRPLGDPLVNQERAIALYRQFLDLVTMDDDGYSWALAQTNLGLSLLERARERHTNEPPWAADQEPVENLAEVDEAIEHFDAALRWRSFERDPRDWAFTQVNLGLTYNRRPGGDHAANLHRALEHYRNAERGYAEAGDHPNHAQVLHNMSSSTLALARLAETPEGDRQGLLRAAVDQARASLAERTLDDAPVDAGRTWRQVGQCLEALGDVDGAIDAYGQALRGLKKEVAPRLVRDAAQALGDLAGESERWELAAQAWETAAEAAAQAWEARATFAGRIDELRENLNIFRWAAYALARVGRLERAVEVLELGRSRELARWLQADLIDLDRLRDLDPQLADQYTALRSTLRRLERDQRAGGSVDGAEAAAAAEGLASIIGAIRALPGFEAFLDVPRFSDTVAALEPGDALAYLITSPKGSLALVVAPDGGDGKVRLVQAPTLTSTDLFRLFMAPDLERQTVTGYLSAHAGLEGTLEQALDGFVAALGPALLRPLRDELAATGARTVCLVPVSLLGLLPLHALAWPEGGNRRCLLDEFTVVFAPSALVRRVCLQRAARASGPRRAVVVGNPLPQTVPLPGAELEAGMVARALAAEELNLLVREAATKDAVVAVLPGATHVHLACHGAASILDRPMNTALSLANNTPLHAEEILELSGFAPRLVVASACETGVIQGYETADEALTLGAMFVAAGAAGVVSTLWSISDRATALLMSRFYELLIEQPKEQPAVALREAQRWLRELTNKEAESYITARPALRQHQTPRGKKLPDGGKAATLHPFSKLTMWGAFVFSGA
jgi:CHAT domain-containing protein/tetratricopeptide (TPR) repeat protein